jgi:DNA adenine methylase
MTEKSTPLALPLVKWVGGKRQLQAPILKIIESVYLEEQGTYFEPFFGGGAILFALEPHRATVSDINEGLVNLYKQVRENLETVVAELRIIEDLYNACDETQKFDFYLKERKIFNTRGLDGSFVNRTGAAGAARFLLLNKAGFNGMYRENARGEFNIPFGKRSFLRLFDDDNLRSVSKSLQAVEINAQSYEATVASAQPGDFVYFDPPYAPLTATSNFEAYNSSNLGGFDQVALRDVFVELTEKGIHCLLSNSSSQDIADLYKGFRIEGVSANRAVSATSAGRKKVKEFLIDNFDQVKN